MDTLTLAGRSNQDYAGFGRIGKTDYVFIFDGHGTNNVIDQIRAMNMDEIAVSENPVMEVHLRLKGSTYRSGSTMVLGRKTGNIVEMFHCGDSCGKIYLNGEIAFETTDHSFLDQTEINRTKHLVRNILDEKAPFPISPVRVAHVSSPSAIFNTGEQLVPSQSLGHNNMTGLAPQYMRMEVKRTDRVRMVVGSDGLFDMLVDTREGSAASLVNEAVRRWCQEWEFEWYGRIVPNRFDDRDDVAIAILDDTIKERPSMCIPYSPNVYTAEDVRRTAEAAIGGVRQVDEVMRGTHKVFFVHFHPSENVEIYKKSRLRLWMTDDFHWTLVESRYADGMRGVDDTYGKGEDAISECSLVKIARWMA